MELRYPSVFERRWDRREVTLLACLVVLPNLLGLLNFDTGLGFKFHVFQLGIVIAALFYGMLGGLLVGVFGSIYSAILINNPYIIIGNAILGVVAGYLIGKGYHTMLAVWVGFAIQIPWLVFSDHVLVGMPLAVIWMIVMALALSNTVWSAVGHYVLRPRVRAFE